MFQPQFFYEAGKPRGNFFTSIWNTANAGVSANNQIRLPLAYGFPYIVDWGDGVVNTVTSTSDTNITHTYSTSGTKTIKILNAVTGFAFNNAGDRLKLLEITNWGDFTLSNATFYGCTNLRLLNVRGVPKLGSILNNAFRSCSAITTINNLNLWNLSSVTSIAIMFYGCTSFNGIGLENWNVSNVTVMVNLFSLCNAFNRALNWNVSNVTDMAFMFENTAAFVQDISHFNFNKNVILQAFFVNKSIYPATFYDALLKKWAESFIGTGRTQTNKSINCGAVKYTAFGKTYRDALIANGWTITDGGLL